MKDKSKLLHLLWVVFLIEMAIAAAIDRGWL